MKKKIAKNIVLIMSGGSGQRFGADKPKQYCLMGGRPIIEYAIDVCRLSAKVDGIVIVTAADYLDTIREKYGFPTTVGGPDRQTSLANGLKYVADHYECDKVIIANAVCPLMKEEQINLYFDLLDEYDYVLTCWKVVSTLHTYRGENVDRNDYFHVMEPEAYRFKMLYENYKADFPVPYNFHQLPKNAKGYYCFDYPYTMKITYASDVKIAEILYHDYIGKPKNDKTLQSINLWNSSFHSDGSVSDWLAKLPSYLEELCNRWEISSYTINPLTYVTCVFEAVSRKYGDVIMKFHAPAGRYDVESLYYRHADPSYMARMIDCDDEYRALLIEKIKPGTQAKFDPDDESLREFFDNESAHLIPVESLKTKVTLPTILSEFQISIQNSERYNFQAPFKHNMDKLALALWEKYFANAPQYFLHRDFHRRNLLRCYDKVRAIDPMGVVGPKEFEYVISFVIEAKSNPDRLREMYDVMMDYFSKYCDRKRLYMALFIMWVHKMDEYIFAKHDDFKQANFSADYIRNSFFAGDSCTDEKDYLALFESCYK